MTPADEAIAYLALDILADIAGRRHSDQMKAVVFRLRQLKREETAALQTIVAAYWSENESDAERIIDLKEIARAAIAKATSAIPDRDRPEPSA